MKLDAGRDIKTKTSETSKEKSVYKFEFKVASKSVSKAAIPMTLARCSPLAIIQPRHQCRSRRPRQSRSA